MLLQHIQSRRFASTTYGVFPVKLVPFDLTPFFVSNTSSAATDVYRRIMHGVAIDEVLAEETASGTSWALPDHLGTIHDWVDAATGTSTHYVYSAFGRILSIDGGDPEYDDHLFGFTGRETDADTHITDHWMYYRARYYNPSTGRFVSQDPIGFLAGDANLYRYVGNEATGATDPSGLIIVPKEKPEDSLFGSILRSFGEPDPSDFMNPIGMAAKPVKPIVKTTIKSASKFAAKLLRAAKAPVKATENLGSNILEIVGDARKCKKLYTVKSPPAWLKNLTSAKPAQSPDPIKWANKGGSISQNADGTWVYHDWEGHSVAYTGGYPDFEDAGLVKFKATVKQKPDRYLDYKEANVQLGRSYDTRTERWHHHEDGEHMMLLDASIHARFRHEGGCAVSNTK